MKHPLAFLALYFAAYGLARAEPQVPIDYSASVTAAPVTGVHVAQLENQVGRIKAVASDPSSSDGSMQASVSALFDRINESAGANIVTPKLEGWAKPDPYSPDATPDKGGIEGMLDKVGQEVDQRRSAPAEVSTAYRYGRQMRAQGLVDYTDQLGNNQLGVYVYTKNSPIGIYFNAMFFDLQKILGDALAAATLVHESAHSRDHAEGRLNPKGVKKGEEMAFRSEYWWMRTIDPKGQKLAWARGSFCGQESAMHASTDVCEYLEHLAQILRYGDRNDFEGLVAALGYQDRSKDPFGGNAEVLGGGGDFNDRFMQEQPHEDPPIEAHYHGDGDGH